MFLKMENGQFGDNLITIGLPDYKGWLSYSQINYLGFHRLKKTTKPSSRSKKCLWFTHPAFPSLINLHKWDRIAYDCSDFWSSPWVNRRGMKGYYQKIKNHLLVTSEERIANFSDVVCATSEFLAEYIYSLTNKKVLVVENGVEVELFSKSQDEYLDVLQDIPKPRLGFVGGLKSKIDFELLEYLAKKRPNYNIVLIGPISQELSKSLASLFELKNVFLIGGVPPDRVPYYMRSLDLGLLPYKQIEYNKAVSPLKLFEYLGAGKAAVGIGLPTTRKYSQEGIYYYADDYTDFLKSCDYVIEQLTLDGQNVENRILIAKGNDWKNKLKEIYNKVIGGY